VEETETVPNPDLLIALVLIHVKQPPQLSGADVHDTAVRVDILRCGHWQSEAEIRARSSVSLVRLAAHAHNDAAPATPPHCQGGIDALSPS
jgi:hypothetical protein